MPPTKVWLDALTPKQLNCFHRLRSEFEKQDTKTWLTSRHYEQVLPLIDLLGADTEVVGRFGGASLEGKLEASIERLGKLLRRVVEESPDAVISSGSPEAARIAYGLAIPHFCISDSPHSPIYPLSLPLSALLFCPWVIPRKEWMKHGIRRNRIRHYKALDPVIWLSDFSPDPSAPTELGLGDTPYITFRLPEVLASYLLQVERAKSPKVIPMLKKLSEIFPEHKVVIMSRYATQAKKFKGLGRNFVLLDKVVDGPSLIHFSSIFIGGGGTMTQEACLLGIPTVSVYPAPLPTVIKYLCRRRLVHHFSNFSSATKHLRKISGRIDEAKEEQRRKAKALWRIMKDPRQDIVENVVSHTEKIQSRSSP